MSRLIDADALLEAMKKEDVLKVYECIQLVNNALTVQREGWVSVPIEPTTHMITSGYSASIKDGYRFGYDQLIASYKSMLAAAPTETE